MAADLLFDWLGFDQTSKSEVSCTVILALIK